MARSVARYRRRGARSLTPAVVLITLVLIFG